MIILLVCESQELTRTKGKGSWGTEMCGKRDVNYVYSAEDCVHGLVSCAWYPWHLELLAQRAVLPGKQEFSHEVLALSALLSSWVPPETSRAAQSLFSTAERLKESIPVSWSVPSRLPCPIENLGTTFNSRIILTVLSPFDRGTSAIGSLNQHLE